MPACSFAGISTVFLDRDGVINRKPPEDDYVKCWEEFVFLPGAVEALALLNRRRIRTILVTNQRGVGRGRMTRQDLDRIHQRMQETLARAAAALHAIYVCTDLSGPMCKPNPGMLLWARDADPSIDLRASAMIGDRLSDLQAGHAAGCLTLLISTGAQQETRRLAEQIGVPIHGCAASLYDAVTGLILGAAPVRAPTRWTRDTPWSPGPARRRP